MVSRQWSGVDFLKKSFVKYNTSFNTSFHTVLSTWKTKDNKNSDTDVAVFELKRKKQAGDGSSSSFCTHQEALAEPSFSSGAFDAIYTLGEELGAGAFSVVKAATHRTTKASYAVKIATKADQTPKERASLHVEIAIMQELHHPNVVRLHDTFQGPDHYFLVMEKIEGGELLDRLVLKACYNEKEARDTCVALFQAMEYCHSQNVAHRDLKMENILLLSKDDDSSLKIADFGFSKKCPEDGLTSMCGTPGYVAPELLEKIPYDWQCDMWSLGVVVFILLGGYAPFEEPDQRTLFHKIVKADYEFHEEYWTTISDDAKDLIRSLLTLDPRKRLTASQALEHKWIRASDHVLAEQDLGVNLTELKKFNAKRKWRAAVKTVVFSHKLKSLFSVREEE